MTIPTFATTLVLLFLWFGGLDTAHAANPFQQRRSQRFAFDDHPDQGVIDQRGGGRLALHQKRKKNLPQRKLRPNDPLINQQKNQFTPTQASAVTPTPTTPNRRQNVPELASPSTSSTAVISKNNKKHWYVGISASAAVLLIALAIIHRESWVPLVTDKERLQTAVVELLQGLRPDDPNDLGQRMKAYSSYGLGMMFWECVGLSTIPVETAAGMVFGWPALLASASGKLLGASLAFGLGKWKLQEFVEEKLADNNTCQLLKEKSAARHPPLLSALLMKFSCFPETVKNFGTAAFLPSVTFGHFLAATTFHGCMFTALWTWLGVETSQQLEQTATTSSSVGESVAAGMAASADKNSWGLQLALGGMLLMGFVLSPLSMAWWVRDLQRDDPMQNEKKVTLAKTKTMTKTNRGQSQPRPQRRQ